MNFDPNERALLGALADVLIPADGTFPAASAAEVAGAGLDQVLAVRPDLAEGLKRLLSEVRGRGPVEYMAGLEQRDPAGFGLLTELVPAAYFLNATVRAMLGYSGQTPRPIEPNADYLEDGLLQAVIDRGPIYRRTVR